MALQHNANMYMSFNNLDIYERLYKTQYRLDKTWACLKTARFLTQTYGVYIMRINTLNDNTNGFRFNIAGLQGLYRKRIATRRYGIKRGDSMTGFHFGKRSLYLEGGKYRRALHNLAG